MLSVLLLFSVLLIRCVPTSTLFPYTTLFRSLDIPVEIGRLEMLLRIPCHSDTESGRVGVGDLLQIDPLVDRKSTRLNSSHVAISYAVFCLKKKMRAR